jgi:hypothetical protein
MSCRDVVYLQDSYGTTGDRDSSIPSDGCAPAGVFPLVCQNFESGLTSRVETKSGEVALETSEIFAGAASMRAFSTGDDSFAEMVESFNSIDSGTVYFRVFLYIPVGNTVGTTKVLNLSSLDPVQSDEDIGVDINISAQRSIDIYQHGNAARFKSDPGMVPEGVWFCVKGSYMISETAGATSVWIDDRLAVSTTASADSIINGGIGEFRAGIGWIGDGQLSSTVYFDDILVAASPVECSDL